MRIILLTADEARFRSGDSVYIPMNNAAREFVGSAKLSDMVKEIPGLWQSPVLKVVGVVADLPKTLAGHWRVESIDIKPSGRIVTLEPGYEVSGAWQK